MENIKALTLFVLFILSIVLFVYNRKIASDIEDDKNVSKTLKDANDGILVISSILFTLILSIIVCRQKCTTFKTDSDHSDNVYFMILTALGLSIIILGVIINSASTSVSSDAPVIWGCGIGIIVLSFFYSNYACNMFSGLCKKV